MSLYSIQMGSGDSGVGFTAGPVPDGFVWVVRDVTATLVGSGPDELVIEAEASALTIVLQGTSAGDTRQWTGRQVLNAGDSLAVGSGASWNVAISGYQLSL